MKPLILPLAGGAAAAVLLIAAIPQAAHAQAYAGEEVDANAVVGASGDWTLRQRETWLSTRLDMARDDGTINDDDFYRVRHELGDIHHDESALRDDHDGQLTDNETLALETRLDGVASQIHWLRDAGFQRPW